VYSYKLSLSIAQNFNDCQGSGSGFHLYIATLEVTKQVIVQFHPQVSAEALLCRLVAHTASATETSSHPVSRACLPNWDTLANSDTTIVNMMISTETLIQEEETSVSATIVKVAAC